LSERLFKSNVSLKALQLRWIFFIVEKKYEYIWWEP